LGSCLTDATRGGSRPAKTSVCLPLCRGPDGSRDNRRGLMTRRNHADLRVTKATSKIVACQRQMSSGRHAAARAQIVIASLLRSPQSLGSLFPAGESENGRRDAPRDCERPGSVARRLPGAPRSSSLSTLRALSTLHALSTLRAFPLKAPGVMIAHSTARLGSATRRAWGGGDLS
jgi:hypothetical protein